MSSVAGTFRKSCHLSIRCIYYVRLQEMVSWGFGIKSKEQHLDRERFAPFVDFLEEEIFFESEEARKTGERLIFTLGLT